MPFESSPGSGHCARLSRGWIGGGLWAVLALLCACGEVDGDPAGLTFSGTPWTVGSGVTKYPDLLAGWQRGINLGNALDAPSEGEWGVVLGENHFRFVAEAGFDHIRLPVRFSAHTGGSAGYEIDEGFLRRVDWAIDQALKRNLGVLLDFHHYVELMENPEGQQERFLALWRQISSRYRNASPKLAFDLLNEPNGQMTDGRWNQLLARVIAAVRVDNPTRLLVIEGVSWASPYSLSLLELPTPAADPNIVGSFHFYTPILFTHQGAFFMSPEYGTTGVVFPGPPSSPLKPVAAAQKVDWVRNWFAAYNTSLALDNPSGPRALQDDFAHVDAFLQRGIPLYLGEFAAIDRADPGSRVRWIRAVRTEAERRGIGWSYWDDGGVYQILDPASGQWLQSIRDALLD